MKNKTTNLFIALIALAAAKRTGRFTPFKRFEVSFPSMPPQGASALIKPHTKPH